MKPLIHAKISVKKFGGHLDDYLPIHNFIDSSKSTYADVRHRAILHSTFGIYLAEQVFGSYIINSEDKEISVRDVAENHVFEDLKCIPTVEKWLENMEVKDWMYGKPKKSTISPLVTMDELTLDSILLD